MALPLWKNLKFFTFWTSSFHSLERRFSVPEYHKKNFSWPILPKKKQVGKMSIFRLFEPLVFIG